MQGKDLLDHLLGRPCYNETELQTVKKLSLLVRYSEGSSQLIEVLKNGKRILFSGFNVLYKNVQYVIQNDFGANQCALCVDLAAL